MGIDLTIVATALALYAAGVVSPGPNFALVSRLALCRAKKTAVGATVGLALGSTFYAVLTMAGLALVLTRVGWLSASIQIAGGCYLIYLGIKAWFRGSTTQGVAIKHDPGNYLRGLRSGSIVNFANPKCIAFFVSLYSVVVPASATIATKVAISIGGFALEILWYGLVIIMLSSGPARSAFQQFGLWIERAIGTLLAGFGFRLIAEKL